MSQKQKPNLVAALAEAGGGTRRRTAFRAEKPAEARANARDAAPVQEPALEEAKMPFRQPGRVGKVPITCHFPKQVRDQLKILAIEQGSTLHNLHAEAYNDLFAKYGKPEIAPRENGSQVGK